MGTRTITLTDRPPVRIDEARWPEVGSALWHDGEVIARANRKATVKVRQERPGGLSDNDWDGLPVTDGRVIVHGTYRSDFRDESDRRSGFVLEDPTREELVATIREVADAVDFPGLADECVASLPAEEL